MAWEHAAMEEIGVEMDSHAELSLCFDALVRSEYARIRGLAWKFGCPAEDLDDAAQEIFTLAWQGRGNFRGDCAPATWLTRIAVNSLISRKRKRLPRWQGTQSAEAADLAAPQGPGAEVMEAHARAIACVERLAPKLRAVFVLHYLEEMSCVEVAAALELPEATVRTRLFHARKKLRGMMKGYEP